MLHMLSHSVAKGVLAESEYRDALTIGMHECDTGSSSEHK